MGRSEGLGIALAAVWAASLLFYGAVAPWALAFTAAALAALEIAAARMLPEPLRLARGTVAFLAGCAVVFALQLAPAMDWLFPYTARLREAHGATGGYAAGTADLFLTLRGMCQTAVYALTGLVTLRLLRNGLRPSKILVGACVVLLAQALYAVLQVGLPIEGVPFYGPRPYSGSASGTLVNRNSFGGLMAIGLCFAVGLAMARFVRGGPRRFEAAGLWCAAALAFGIGVVLSQSRGAALAALAGALLVPFAARGRAIAAGAATLAALSVVAIILVDPVGLLARFERVDPFEIGAEERVVYWRTTLAGWRHQPLLGFGIGSHPRAYHPFQPPTVAGQIDHAHNEYVNALFEGGTLWVVTLLAGASVWLAGTIRRLSRLDGPSRAISAGAIGAVVAVLAHSLVDFDLRITSIGMAFAAALATGSIPSPNDARARRGGIAAAVAAAVALAGAAGVRFDPDSKVDAALAAEPERAKALVGSALAASPYDHRAAWLWAKLGADDPRRYVVAADLWPAHPDLQREAGLWLWRRGESTLAARCFGRLFQGSPAALGAVMESIWEEGRDLQEYEELLPNPAGPAAVHWAAFLVDKGRWREGVDAFDRLSRGGASADELDLFAARLHAAGQWGLEAEIRERRLALAPDAAAYAAAARAWANLGAFERAADRASMAARVDPGRARWHALRGDILMRVDGRAREAIEAWTEAARLAPEDWEIRVGRGKAYLSHGVYARAVEDLEWAHRMRPRDREAAHAYARALAGMGLRSEALRALDRHLARDDGDAAGRALRAELERERER